MATGTPSSTSGASFRNWSYDNLSLSVRRILRGKQRIEQERFVSFRSTTHTGPGSAPGSRTREGGRGRAHRLCAPELLGAGAGSGGLPGTQRAAARTLSGAGRRRIRGRGRMPAASTSASRAERGRLLPCQRLPLRTRKVVRVRVDHYRR